MMSSTRSSESALRSSTKEAPGRTSSSSTPSCSTTIARTRSNTVATCESSWLLRNWIGLGFRVQRLGIGRPCGKNTFAYGPQYSVYEAWRAFPAVAVGQLYSFVHDCRDRGRIICKQFPYCKAQDVPVNDSQCVNRILRGGFLNEFIEGITPFDNTCDDLAAILARPRLADRRVCVDGFS